MQGSGVPATVARATQSNAFVLRMLRATGTLPIMFAPAGVRLQSLSRDEFADHLLQHLTGGPLGRAPDFAGPEILQLSDTARSWPRVRGKRRAPNPPRAVGRLRWPQWLEVPAR